MTPSELKAKIEATRDDSYFFDRKTMKYFGDTMANFGVRSATIVTRDWPDNGDKFITVDVWELYRKSAERYGANGNAAYFRKDTFARVFAEKAS